MPIRPDFFDEVEKKRIDEINSKNENDTAIDILCAEIDKHLKSIKGSFMRNKTLYSLDADRIYNHEITLDQHELRLDKLQFNSLKDILSKVQDIYNDQGWKRVKYTYSNTDIIFELGLKPLDEDSKKL